MNIVYECKGKFCTCSIYIGDTLFNQKILWQKLIVGSQVCIVTNETLAPLYLSELVAVFSEYQCDTLILPEGETYKTIESWQKILNILIEKQHKRNTTLIALGGGVIGDITGFAAACYQRGVNFIQVPTTLLAQVDASIGGKTGVNYQHQKNFIGAFHQPKAVIIDTVFLSTLSEREFRAGLAEVIKYALIHDKQFFDYLCNHVEKILARSEHVLTYIIEKCVNIKSNFVKQDEYDETGKRALLNFGHTFGHALESAMDFKILHGEAVAWGMLKACYLSQSLGYLSQTDVIQVKKILQQCGLLITLNSALEINKLLAIMRQDKKNEAQGLVFILLKEIGSAFVEKDIRLDSVQAVMAIKDGDVE